MPDGATLTPLTGTILVLVTVVAGRNFRINWKVQAPGWQVRSWFYGVAAGLSLLALAFIPLNY